MKKLLKQVSNIIDSSEKEISENIHNHSDDISFFGNSVKKKDGAIVSIAKDKTSQFLMIMSPHKTGIITKFSGDTIGLEGLYAKKCVLNSHNAGVIKEEFPWTVPTALHDTKTSIGFGDRLGNATLAHINAISKYDIHPVLAQQSLRELKLTGRTYHDLIDKTIFNVFEGGYTGGYGADANDLQSIDEVNIALSAGITMISLNIAPKINSRAMLWSKGDIDNAFAQLPEELQKRMHDRYFNKKLSVGKTELEFDITTTKKEVIMFYEAILHTSEIYNHLKANCGDNFDLEIALDETTFPTWPESHFFIVNELKNMGVKLSSFAPHFIGSFKRCLDYSGNLNEFTEHFEKHAEIAKEFGGYKISIHDGSNKFKIYPIVNKLTKGHFHLKTSAISWIEAIRTLAVKDSALFRVIYQQIIKNYEQNEKYYKNANIKIKNIPNIDMIYNEDLSASVDNDEFKQLLSISYGSVLENEILNPLLFSRLDKNLEFYHENLRDLFVKFLEELQIPLK